MLTATAPPSTTGGSSQVTDGLGPGTPSVYG
jgi:hypothetical protein